MKQALEHVYNVELEFTDTDILECPFSITRDLKNVPLDEILEVLKTGLSVESMEKVGNNKYILQGGRKCK